MPLNRASLFWTLTALVGLRLVVGMHFAHEGISKIQAGSFDARPFLSQAVGPAAGFFHDLIDDYDGFVRLNIVTDPAPLHIDTRMTVAIWEDWVESVSNAARLDPQQRQVADSILANAVQELELFFGNQQVEILAWANERSRLDGFARDGKLRQRAAREVESLNQQVSQISSQRRQSAAAWFGTIDAIWDNLEQGVSDLAGEQATRPLPRPWAPQNSSLAWINRALPWFDLVVGLLLVAGLATRLAAAAGMCLLAGVLATQPFWVPAAANTWYQWIELAALFLLLAAGAGRFAGLDYFLTRSKNQIATEPGDHL